MLGARRCHIGRAIASDGRWFPKGLHLLQNSKSGFGKMTGDSAGGDGGTTPGANALVEPDDVTVLPGFEVIVDDNHVGGFDESELQVLVGFLAEMAVVEFSAGT
jgi:hypothetical protein